MHPDVHGVRVVGARSGIWEHEGSRVYDPAFDVRFRGGVAAIILLMGKDASLGLHGNRGVGVIDKVGHDHRLDRHHIAVGIRRRAWELGENFCSGIPGDYPVAEWKGRLVRCCLGMNDGQGGGWYLVFEALMMTVATQKERKSLKYANHEQRCFPSV